MFVVLCYDINIKRNYKVKKIARKFLRPVQKSVCEGYITEGKLNKLCAQLKKVIKAEEDAIVIYKLDNNSTFEKYEIGQALNNDDFIL